MAHSERDLRIGSDTDGPEVKDANARADESLLEGAITVGQKYFATTTIEASWTKLSKIGEDRGSRSTPRFSRRIGEEVEVIEETADGVTIGYVGYNQLGKTLPELLAMTPQFYRDHEDAVVTKSYDVDGQRAEVVTMRMNKAGLIKTFRPSRREKPVGSLNEMGIDRNLSFLQPREPFEETPHTRGEPYADVQRVAFKNIMRALGVSSEDKTL